MQEERPLCRQRRVHAHRRPEQGHAGSEWHRGRRPPLACGAALAAKTLGTGGVAVSFVGDGGANQGTFLESLNLASIWSLPCVFVIENNGYAEATSSKYAGSCNDFADRANGFGMPGVTVDDTTSSPSTKPRARQSSGLAGVAGRPWWNAKSIATTAITKATPNPIAVRTRWIKSASQRSHP